MKDIQEKLKTWRNRLRKLTVVIGSSFATMPAFYVGWVLGICFGGLAVTSFAETKYAVCIGINKYASLSSLSTCVNDANYFYTNLMERGGWQQSNMTILKDKEAKKNNIRMAISNYAAKAVSGDTFIYQHSSIGGQNSGKSVFLCCYDNNYEDTEVAADLASFAKGVKVVMVVDACHSGGLIKKRNREIVPFNLPERVTAIMTENQAQRLAREECGMGKAISASEIGWVTSVDYNEYAYDGGFYDTDVWLTSTNQGSVTGGLFLASFIWAWKDGSADIKAGYGDNDQYADPYECWAVASVRCKNYAKRWGLFDPITPQCTNVTVLRSVELGWAGGEGSGTGSEEEELEESGVRTYNTNITITTLGRAFDKAGGAASVLTGGSGEWSARTDVNWITLTRTNGEAGVSCIYAVGANWTAETRIGHIYIEDKTYTVTQNGYEAEISPISAEWDYQGGSGSLAVSVDAGVAWTAVANVEWITVKPSSGRGSGSTTYTVAAYDETTTRSGSLTVAGQTFAVIQTGTDVTLSPMRKTLDWRANAFEVIVGALSTTEWTPVSEVSWLSVVDAGYGRGNATILVAAGENPSVKTRTGTVAVGSKRVTVTQTGTRNLALELTPMEATASSVGAYGNIAVYGTPDAVWEAAPTVEWITISDGTSGAGNGNIKYIVMANPLLTERTGQIKVTLKPGAAGGTAQTAVHTVTQGVIEPVVSPTEVSFGAAGGSGRVQLTVAANTQWTAKSNNGWLKVTSATSSAGSATVAFDASANPSTESRIGSLEIAGKTVTVTQVGLWSQLVYDGRVFGTSSDSGFIDVQVEGDGTWTASTDASWLTLMDTNGHGSASIMFVVDDYNTAVASRTAVVTIAGKTIEITQRGYELSIDPAVAELGSNAGAGEIGISAPIDALWEAIVTVDWIQLVGETTGFGNGTLRYTVADNATGELQTGKIIISGQEYTVTQHANLTLTALVEGSGAVEGAGDYETNERVTLRAVPAEGFAFTHWSGDAVGVESEVTIVMDMAKTVTAHFIPEDAAQRLAEEKAAQGGFYTREQLKALAMGDTVIEVDGESGTVDLALQLLETTDLVGGEWDGADVPEGNGSVTVDAEGKVHVRVVPKGNTAFYRLVNVTEGEE